MSPLDQSRFRAVVFDKDGTLFDFARTWEAWANAFIMRLADTPEHAKRIGAAIGFDTVQSRFEPGSPVIAGSPDEISALLLAELDGYSHRELLTIVNQEAARAPQMEAVPLAPYLKGLRDRGLLLGVATNDAEMPARAHLDAAGVTEYFDFIAGYDSGFGGKPGPGQLLGFADAMGLEPAQCVMVGDSLHDMHAGRSAGFATVGVLTGYARETDLAPFADVVLAHIGLLPDWLSGKLE